MRQVLFHADSPKMGSKKAGRFRARLSAPVLAGGIWKEPRDPFQVSRLKSPYFTSMDSLACIKSEVSRDLVGIQSVFCRESVGISGRQCLPLQLRQRIAEQTDGKELYRLAFAVVEHAALHAQLIKQLALGVAVFVNVLLGKDLEVDDAVAGIVAQLDERPVDDVDEHLALHELADACLELAGIDLRREVGEIAQPGLKALAAQLVGGILQRLDFVAQRPDHVAVDL